MTDGSLSRAATKSALLTAALLVVPLLAMQITNEVDWGIGDFFAAGALLFGASMVYHLAARRTQSGARKKAIAALLFAAVGLIWAELAVGLFA